MTFRKLDYNIDIPDAVNLIKKGLDTEYTETFFRWKHLENPFGESYGLVAIDQGKIVGLRMFMFWKFINKKQNKIHTSIRPVDTVVDNNYRGKGLFKQLTLKGLEECKGEYDLIFNTPNENSLPGYLKMGWKKIPANSFYLGVFNFLFFNSKTELNQFSSNLNLNSDGWETEKSDSFLRWRYKDSKYAAVSLKTANLIYSINKLGFFKQIVIHELVGEVEDLKLIIKMVSKKHTTPFVYYYSNLQSKNLKPFYKAKRKQAIVVAREDTYNLAGSINFSLGDLEGKL